MNLHLIDGTYELFRSFYGAPKATGPDGSEVGAARGLMRSLLSLLREKECTHIAIAFDHVIESYRNDLFAGYKTGEGIDPELWSQAPLVEEVAAALGIVVWPMIEFEADDALATAAARWKHDEAVERIYLCSPDKDLAQCVDGTKVVLLDRMRRKVIDESAVVEKWGVPPSAIPDLLALMGDTADGIPGVPRWGAKSCAAVLGEYGSLEAIPLDAEDWSIKVRGAKSLAENLKAQTKEAALYKLLATLREDVPLEEDLADLEWGGTDRAAFAKIAARLGDERAADRVPRWRE